MWFIIKEVPLNIVSITNIAWIRIKFVELFGDYLLRLVKAFGKSKRSKFHYGIKGYF